MEINAARRLQATEVNAAWGANRLGMAIKGDEAALKDVPKIIDDAARNVKNLLEAHGNKIKSLQRIGDKATLKAELKNLQKLVKAIED